jgi:copper chaperone CopZ
MKYLFPFLFLFSITVFFSSCFEITEEINMKSNGSGDMLLTVNMSQSKVNLTNYMKMEEVQGIKVPKQSEIEEEISNVKKALAQIKGLSSVKINSDFSEFIFTVSGQFDNVKTLNVAINKVAGELNRTPFPIIKKDNFDFSSGKFTRYFDYLKKLNFTQQEYDDLDFTQKFIMESAKYTSIYRFDKPVKKVSNTKAEVAPSKKAVKLESNFAEILTGRKAIENVITY